MAVDKVWYSLTVCRYIDNTVLLFEVDLAACCAFLNSISVRLFVSGKTRCLFGCVSVQILLQFNARKICLDKINAVREIQRCCFSRH